jgi:hypothetical protein
MTYKAFTRLAVTLFIFLLISNLAKSQDGNWDAYLAQYEKGPGSVTLNMDLINRAPIREFPYLVITGVNFKNCKADGFPTDLHELYKISDDIALVINSATKNELVGTFMYQCRRADYIYVSDTLNLRSKLIKAYKEHYKNYKYYISIKPDKAWGGYLEFLYPNEETQEYMRNGKVLMQLQEAGDKSEKPRQVDHWVYFNTAKDRDLFKKYAEGKGFKIEGEEFTKESELPYQLGISKVTAIEISTISAVTLQLRKKAKELRGEYDGWETVVVK